MRDGKSSVIAEMDSGERLVFDGAEEIIHVGKTGTTKRVSINTALKVLRVMEATSSAENGAPCYDQKARALFLQNLEYDRAHFLKTLRFDVRQECLTILPTKDTTGLLLHAAFQTGDTIEHALQQFVNNTPALNEWINNGCGQPASR